MKCFPQSYVVVDSESGVVLGRASHLIAAMVLQSRWKSVYGRYWGWRVETYRGGMRVGG